MTSGYSPNGLRVWGEGFNDYLLITPASMLPIDGPKILRDFSQFGCSNKLRTKTDVRNWLWPYRDMWILLLMVFVLVYFSFYWAPRQGTKPAPHEMPGSRDNSFASNYPEVHLRSQHTWYGITIDGYQDDYSLQTTASVAECLKCVRDFFTFRGAKVESEAGHRILFSRGKEIYKYLGGSDTWVPQNVAVSFDIENEGTIISIYYRTQGLGIRTPPNQFRREVLQLRDAIQSISMR